MAVRLHVETTGPEDGRNVVLIHGWPLSGQSWEKQVGPLVDAGFRVTVYDRRGFGQSEKPDSGFDYDTLADDLAQVLEEGNLRDVTLVGFSMGGGEVARYISRYGEDRLHSVVFAAAIPPFMMKTADNPEGPLTREAADEMEAGLKASRDDFFPEFARNFFSVGGELKVSTEDLQKAIALCHQSDQTAALGCMKAFGTTDFREDLKKITVPTLVLHGDADDIVPFDGSGKRTHQMVSSAELTILSKAPHGCNVSHADEFNRALLEFLKR